MIIPIDRFFREMELPEEEKKRREDLANDLLILFLLFFTEIEADILADKSIDVGYFKDMLFRQYCDRVETYVVMVAALLGTNKLSKSLKKDIRQRTSDIVDTTVKYINDSAMRTFSTSNDRATFLSCNEANYVGNDTDYHIAEYQGYRHKQWLTMKDERVRPTHAVIDGQILPIDEYFHVGLAEMLYPMDMSRNAYDHPEETSGCRCVVEYLR